MVLPSIDSSPVLLFRFTSKADSGLIEAVKERLKGAGLLIVTTDTTSDGQILLGLSTTQKDIEREAELVKLVKPTTSALVGFAPAPVEGGTLRNNAVHEHFTVAGRENFVRFPDTYPKDVDPITEYDSFGLFTSADRAMLVWSILDSVHVLPADKLSSNLSRKLDELGVPYLHSRHYYYENLKSMGFSKGNIKIAGGDDRERSSQSLRHVLQDSGLVDVVSPSHIPHIQNKIVKETLNVRTGAPLTAMRDYYGEEITFYFAWMMHFSTWLIFPGLLGLTIFTMRLYRGDTVDTCDLTPFHGLGTFLWGVLFLRYWEREEARLSYAWGTYGDSLAKKKYGARPEFEGELKPSPVTGALEKYYSPTKRRLKYVVSALLSSILLAGAGFVMILSLNLQGYVRPRDDRGRWGQDHDHPFYYPMLATFADEGNIFDAASHWKWFLPVVIHVLVVMAMNELYRRVAEKLTDWENHESKIGHENSLIIKRFLFEAFDAYVILLYLAFFEKDITKLRGELVSVFNVDTFRRLLVECALPLVMQRLGKDTDYHAKMSKKTDGSDASDAGKSTRLTVESCRDEYEQFDDYLEMLIELGYVTLFASAYPLAAFIAIFANFVEYRADAWKLSRVCLRPRAIRTDSIGTWKLLMKVIIWGSALTNCLIFCFTSRQMLQWMPGAFSYDETTGHKSFVAGKGWYVVLTMFGIERALLVFGLLILLIVPSVPEDVAQLEERRQFVREQASERIRSSSFLKKRMDEGSIRSIGSIVLRPSAAAKISDVLGSRTEEE